GRSPARAALRGARGQAVLRPAGRVHGLRPGARRRRRGRPGDRRAAGPGRQHRPDDRPAGDDPRRPGPRLGPAGDPEPGGRLGLGGVRRPLDRALVTGGVTVRLQARPLHLKTLTLRGYKSFAAAATLRFEPGVTCVLGPNGSGKSNVVDALA